MLSDPEPEQELAESHLMLKNAWLCFRISSSFVGNNPSLQIISFSEDRGKCNKTGIPSISNFSTILTSYNRVLAPPMLSLIVALLRVQAQRATFFRQNFHLSVIMLGGNVSILSHDICRLIIDYDPAHTIHYL